MKKTLFHSLTFPPDTISTGMIVSEIAVGFNSKFQNVEVLASSPQYNIRSFEKFNKSNTNYKNIKVHYIESNKRKFTNSARFLQWLSFNLNSIKFIYKHRKDYENIFIFSYPPTMNLVCIFTSKILKINTIYSLWELYPEIAEKLKEQPNFVLNKFFKLIDNFCLKSVNKIVVNSDLLKDYLVNNRNIVRNKIEVIHHFSPYKKSDYASNLALKKIFYAGNTSKPQNLNSFIKFFNKNFPQDWDFQLYGAGQEFNNLLKNSNKNIFINEYLARDELEDVTKDIPFALICLDYEITIEGFPGKTFDYLNMNKILINFSNPNSAVSELIKDNGLGFNIDLKKPDEFFLTLEEMQNPKKLNEILHNINKFQEVVSNKEIVSKKYISLISTTS
jgi:glycosyltransferase involved in cell wall biosynthesis